MCVCVSVIPTSDVYASSHIDLKCNRHPAFRQWRCRCRERERGGRGGENGSSKKGTANVDLLLRRS